MGRFFRRGKSKIWFLPDITNPNFPPTATDMLAGLDLSPQIHSVTGFQLTNNPLALPDLTTNFTKSVPGEDVVANCTLTFYDADGPGGFPPGVTHPWAVRGALAKGTVGYIVLFPYGLNKRSDRWHIQTTGVNDEWAIANDAARFQVGFAVLDPPYGGLSSDNLAPAAPTNLRPG